MFRLATPIASSRPISDFDDISTILTHSSLSGSKQAAPWQQHIGEDGQVFYVELTETKPAQSPSISRTDASSICPLCSTRSCHSCASEDTGYSSDTDALPVQPRSTKAEHPVLDSSHESLFHSFGADAELEDHDDGVSVDLLEFDRSDQSRPRCWHRCDDAEVFEQFPHKCSTGISRSHSLHHHLGCATTLCERHSSKFRVSESVVSKLDLAKGQKTCKCGGALQAQCKHKMCDGHKEVILHVRPSVLFWDRALDVSWLESVLGIIPGHANSHKLHRTGDSHSDRIVVKGLSPEGPAVKSKQLYIGDQIHSINGKQITWNNLDIVLSSLHQTRKIRLVVERASSKPSPVSTDRLLRDTGSVLSVLLNKKPAKLTPTKQRRSRNGLEDVCVVYMSIGDEQKDDKREGDDVVYQFPKEDCVLSRLRGSFYTLDHLLADGMDTDTRLLTVKVDSSLVSVACHKEGKDMLIVTAPLERLQASQLLTVANGIVRLLRLLYGSVEGAFSSPQHHGSLDDFLSFIFSRLQPSFKGTHSGVQASLMGYLEHLPLPDDVVVSISNTLTELESADFANLSDSFYDCRRAFTILGSVAFYKGRVTCSHLCPKDAGDVGLYLQHSGLLHLSTRHSLHQCLVWREIFPTRFCHEVAAINSVFGYSEPHARWFLMVVGVKNTLLACILEAGGCSTQIEGVCLPDPFYVDQVRAALIHLQTADIISACEIRLNGDGQPVTTTANKIITSLSPLESLPRGLDTLLKTPSSIVHSLSNGHHINSLVALSNTSMSPGRGLNGKGGWREWRKLSIESDGSSGSGSSSEGGYKNAGKRGRLFPLSLQSSLSHTPGAVLDPGVNTCKVSSGQNNALLVFCHVNEQEGVLVTSPDKRETESGWSHLHRQVVDNFHRCVARMHTDFMSCASAKVYPSEGVLEDIHGDQSWHTCREEGVMFTCAVSDTGRNDSRRAASSLVYWVVGRKFKNLHSREVYVCFHECTPQNVVELAFRLSHGSMSSI